MSDLAVVEARRAQLEEWYAWREDVEAEVAEERAALGLPDDPHTALLEAKTKSLDVGAEQEQQVGILHALGGRTVPQQAGHADVIGIVVLNELLAA